MRVHFTYTEKINYPSLFPRVLGTKTFKFSFEYLARASLSVTQSVEHKRESGWRIIYFVGLVFFFLKLAAC